MKMMIHVYLCIISIGRSDTNPCDDPHYTGTVIPTHVGIVNVIIVGHLPKRYRMIEIHIDIDTE